MVMSDVPNGRAIAKCFYIEQDDKFTLNQRVCSLIAKKTIINPRYLYYALNRNKYFLSFDDGIKQTNLRKDDVLHCPIYLPSLSEQEKVTTLIDSSDKEIELLCNKLEAFKNQKKGLMQKLLTGNIRVKV